MFKTANEAAQSKIAKPNYLVQTVHEIISIYDGMFADCAVNMVLLAYISLMLVMCMDSMILTE